MALKTLPRMEDRLQDMAKQYDAQAKQKLANVKFPAPPVGSPVTVPVTTTSPPTPSAVVNVSQGIFFTPTQVTSSWLK